MQDGTSKIALALATQFAANAAQFQALNLQNEKPNETQIVSLMLGVLDTTYKLIRFLKASWQEE